MGLTNNSSGINAAKEGLIIQKKNPNDKIIALAGNPNVGKSTVFNALTGLNQHTGNWPGKTVTNAQGYYQTKNTSYVLVDIPGTYSLMAHSAEEEVARNFICFGNCDAVIVVCDATCLERNLNLVLQTIEIYDKVIVCVNLIDEAKRKNISINLSKLSSILGVPVVSTIAQKKKSLLSLTSTLDKVVENKIKFNPIKIKYDEKIEKAISIIKPHIDNLVNKKLNSRWLCLKLLENDSSLIKEINSFLEKDLLKDDNVSSAISEAENYLKKNNISNENFTDFIVSSIMKKAESISKECVTYKSGKYSEFDKNIDKILTNKLTGYPVMILLLALVFYITISGANYPSKLLSDFLFYIQDRIMDFLIYINLPKALREILVSGMIKTLFWVVSVMLPPMAIFFPLFTLLEDAGYLPRIAYNLDKTFKRCNACGKQALTMCMGFGCNAAGIIGCRIIDSPRERLLAILTNNFVPCNGRFPAMISIITMFFIGSSTEIFSSISSSLILTLLIVSGIAMTFLMTKLLSKTVLKGVPSSFTLELPPFRKPQIGKLIIRSIFDRTLFVLGRAVSVAAPAGIIIWLSANIYINDISILRHIAAFLDPFARFIGLDGVILIAFILGFPANEIVIPIIIMAYMANGSITEMESLSQMKNLFVQNGWTFITAVCTMIFSLFHWPCSTSAITIKKETGSLKWTLLAIMLPTLVGIITCALFANISRFVLFLINWLL